jgi:hypothetical protein
VAYERSSPGVTPLPDAEAPSSGASLALVQSPSDAVIRWDDAPIIQRLVK